MLIYFLECLMLYENMPLFSGTISYKRLLLTLGKQKKKYMSFQFNPQFLFSLFPLNFCSFDEIDYILVLDTPYLYARSKRTLLLYTGNTVRKEYSTLQKLQMLGSKLVSHQALHQRAYRIMPTRYSGYRIYAGADQNNYYCLTITKVIYAG